MTGFTAFLKCVLICTLFSRFGTILSPAKLRNGLTDVSLDINWRGPTVRTCSRPKAKISRKI